MNKVYKVLIVDDDSSILESLYIKLSQNGEYEILTAANGKSACEIAVIEKPDLILMDWEMPVMNGFDALKNIKSNQLTKDIPVIISTGVMIEATHVCQAFDVGAVDYLRKPINEIELKARISNMIRISTLTATIKQQNIELQNQLTSEVLKIQQLHELKKFILKQLSLLKENVKCLDEKQIVNIVVQTENQLNSKVFQTSWVDFELHFELVYPGFFGRVNTIQSKLSVNELRLCAFLRLNMSNKEIAQILYTSVDSVNTSRKRLKKKFGLQPQDSLQRFVRNI